MSGLSAPLFGSGYHPEMFQERCTVLENRDLGAGHFVLSLSGKQVVAKARPGQFVNLLCEGGAYLRRPFSFLDIQKGRMDLLIRSVGLGTDWLFSLTPGRTVDVIGPLGKGFEKPSLSSKKPVVFVTGGVGYPPLHHFYASLGQQRERIRFIHGVRGKAEANAYKSILHPSVQMVSEDGSTGYQGRVTDFTQDIVFGAVYACGPMGMLKALHDQLSPKGVQVILSIESPMGCGFGVCFGCSVPRASGNGYLLACVEGPVLDSRELFTVPAQ